MKPMNDQMPPEMPQDQISQDQMPPEAGMQDAPQEGGDDLLSSVEAKMQEEGFADNVIQALEGAKDIGAASGMLAGVLVSKMYDPGDDEKDVIAAIEMVLKEVMSIASDMGAKIDQATATAAATQAGQIVISLMDQHDEASDPQGMQEPSPHSQEPQGLQNPYQGLK